MKESGLGYPFLKKETKNILNDRNQLLLIQLFDLLY